jgi:hypothetical protein
MGVDKSKKGIRTVEGAKEFDKQNIQRRETKS